MEYPEDIDGKQWDLMDMDEPGSSGNREWINFLDHLGSRKHRNLVGGRLGRVELLARCPRLRELLQLEDIV